jgi:hypothetical protein
MRTFKFAECCLTCENRSGRIGKNVICAMDNKWYSERLVCSEYQRTTNKRILTEEKAVLPKEASE